MKKKVLCMCLVLLMVYMVCVPVSATKMYAPDGRVTNVDSSDVEAWKNVGWYDYPVQKMYSLSGKTAIISKNAVSDWKKEGWYEVPVTTVYAPNGKIQIIAKSDLSDWKKEGWYEYAVTTVYAPNGKTKLIAKSSLADWKKTGWYEYPVTTVYATDGRTMVVAKKSVNDWVKAGWHKEDSVTMYALDGRTAKVKLWDVAAWKKVGWFEKKNDVVTNIYAWDGTTKVVYKADVPTYVANGWYTKLSDVQTVVYANDGSTRTLFNSEVERLCDGEKEFYDNGNWWTPYPDYYKDTLYSMDGRSITVWIAEAYKYTKVGWKYPETLYALDGRTTEVKPYEVEAYKALGWYTYAGYRFNKVSTMYNQHVAKGDYVSALKVVADEFYVFADTEYESKAKRLKESAMDYLRSLTGCPLIMESYKLYDQNKIEFKFRNVSYKTVTAFRFQFDSCNVFGDVLISGEDNTYSVNSCDIGPGESATFYGTLNRYNIKTIKNFAMKTVVYDDGIIWDN